MNQIRCISFYFIVYITHNRNKIVNSGRDFSHAKKENAADLESQLNGYTNHKTIISSDIINRFYFSHLVVSTSLAVVIALHHLFHTYKDILYNHLFRLLRAFYGYNLLIFLRLFCCCCLLACCMCFIFVVIVRFVAYLLLFYLK